MDSKRCLHLASELGQLPSACIACRINLRLYQTVIHLSVPNHLYRIGSQIAAWGKR